MAKVRLCEVEGCGAKHYGRGMCKEHWNNWYLPRWRKKRPGYQRKWRAKNPEYNSNNEAKRTIGSRLKRRYNPTTDIYGDALNWKSFLQPLKEKLGVPYRDPKLLQHMTPEQIVRRWRTFI